MALGLGWLAVAEAFLGGERPACLTDTPLQILSTHLGADASSALVRDFERVSGLSVTVVRSAVNLTQLAAGVFDADFVVSETLPVPIPLGYVAVPLLTGSISVPYNIPLLNRCAPRLNLSLELLRAIYVGNITVWQDPAILAANEYFRSVANATAPIPIVRLIRGDYDTVTEGFVDGLLYLHNLSVIATPPPAVAGVSPAWRRQLSVNAVAAWASITTPGKPAAVPMWGLDAMEAELLARSGAVGFTVGSTLWDRLPMMTLDGHKPDDVDDVQLAADYHSDRLAELGGLTTLHAAGSDLPPYDGYPLISFVSFLVRGNSSWPAAGAGGQCCARVYWAGAFAQSALGAEAIRGGFVAASEEVAGELAEAVQYRMECGGKPFEQLRAKYDLTLDELAISAASSSSNSLSSRLSGIIAGSAIGGCLLLLLLVAGALWFYFRRRVARVQEMESEAAAAPRGMVALMFTDIESSSELWRACPTAMKQALAAHFIMIRQHVRGNGGYEVKTEGDALFAAFPSAIAAVRAACGIQDGLNMIQWPPEVLSHPAGEVVRDDAGDVLLAGLRVRIGIATGNVDPELDPTTHRLDYFGDPVNYAARISDLGHGGQIVVSADVAAVVEAQRARCGMAGTRRLADAILAGFSGVHEVHEVASALLTGRLGRWGAHRATKADAVTARITRTIRHRVSIRRDRASMSTGPARRDVENGMSPTPSSSISTPRDPPDSSAAMMQSRSFELESATTTPR